MAGKHESTAFLESWPVGGCSHTDTISAGKANINIISWHISGFLEECWRAREESGPSFRRLKSMDVSFDGATFTLFVSFDIKGSRSQFGINIRTSSDVVFDCFCNILFLSYRPDTKVKLNCDFKCESSDLHWSREDFLSESELEQFLRNNGYITCRMRIKKQLKEACSQTEIPYLSGNSSPSLESDTLTEYEFENESTAFVETWPVGGRTRSDTISAGDLNINVIGWGVNKFLEECVRAIRKESSPSLKRMRSPDVSFDGLTFNLFVSFDVKGSRSQVGINVLTNSSDANVDCFCDILFRRIVGNMIIKSFECVVKCESSGSYQSIKDVSASELEQFLRDSHRNCIECRLRIKKLSKVACSQTEITYFSGKSCVEQHTQTQEFENNNKELPAVDFDEKLCQDFNNLLLSEEGSDVTLQVRGHQFKAHSAILAARSTVFASMFRHDTKEKATGVVDIEDCEPSSFPVLLEFLYCGCTDKLSAENVFDLYTSADKYDVQGLKMKCLQFIVNSLSVDTFCETVQLSLHHSEKELLKLATEFFIRNFHQIILTPKWITFLTENPVQGNELFIKATKNMSPSPH